MRRTPAVEIDRANAVVKTATVSEVRLRKLSERTRSAVTARLYGTQAPAKVCRALNWRIVRKRVAMSGGIRAIYSFERCRFHETLTNCPLVFLCLIDLFRYISRKFLGLITQEQKSLLLCALGATDFGRLRPRKRCLQW